MCLPLTNFRAAPRRLLTRVIENLRRPGKVAESKGNKPQHQKLHRLPVDVTTKEAVWRIGLCGLCRGATRSPNSWRSRKVKRCLGVATFSSDFAPMRKTFDAGCGDFVSRMRPFCHANSRCCSRACRWSAKKTQAVRGKSDLVGNRHS